MCHTLNRAIWPRESADSSSPPPIPLLVGDIPDIVARTAGAVKRPASVVGIAPATAALAGVAATVPTTNDTIGTAIPFAHHPCRP